MKPKKLPIPAVSKTSATHIPEIKMKYSESFLPLITNRLGLSGWYKTGT
jgi:hypothetical protein